MAEDPERRRVGELLDRITRGELSEAEAEELELYAADDPELHAAIEARAQQARLGGGWLARVEADHGIARVERSPAVVIARGAASGLVAIGLVVSLFTPVAGMGLLAVGAAVLIFSWLRVNHRDDPYKDIQR